MEKIRMHQFRDPAKGCFLPKPQVVKQTDEGVHIVAPAGFDGERPIRYDWSRDYFLVDDNLAAA